MKFDISNKSTDKILLLSKKLLQKHFQDLTFSSFLYFADGTVHNLNGYFDISAAEAVKEAGDGMSDAVFTQKLGVVVGESQLEEFFSQIS